MLPDAPTLLACRSGPLDSFNDGTTSLTKSPRKSEVDSDLATENQCILDLTRAAWLDDVLNVRLNEQRTLVEIETIGQLDCHFILLNSDIRATQLFTPLGILEIITKVPVDDTEPA